LRAYTFSIAAVVLCCTVEVARARCEMALEGDARTVAQLRTQLDAFEDDSTPCVALRAVCSRHGTEVVLDLSDELGRSAQRRFSTADGAAAFLISWSRRPSSLQGTAIAALPAERHEIAALPADVSDHVRHGAAAAEAEDRWRGELHLAYILAYDSEHAQSMAITGAAVRRSGILRYGGNLRVIGTPAEPPYINGGAHGDPLLWLAVDAEATFGTEWKHGRFLLRDEVGAGGAYLSLLDGGGSPGYQTMGPHAGFRATAATRITPMLWLAAGAGWDVLFQVAFDPRISPFGNALVIPLLHFEVGLQWAP
jgi:hypothetical protein